MALEDSLSDVDDDCNLFGDDSSTESEESGTADFRGKTCYLEVYP